MNDSSIIADFIVAAQECLEELELVLLELEDENDDPNSVIAVVSTLRSIEESARSAGVKGITELSLALENLLEPVGQGKKSLNRELLDTLIEGKDRISLLVDDLRNHHEERSGIETILARIRIQEDVFEEVKITAAREEELINPPLQEKMSPAPISTTSDIAFLKEEIAAGKHDIELFHIFVRQLHENISRLSVLTGSFSEAPDKSQILSRCSDLILKLHSSANYMGYDRLTEFYGQWIAELETSVAELSTGVPILLEFMDRDIQIITELFPQIDDISGNPGHPEEAGLEESSDLFSIFAEAEEDDFCEDSLTTAALSDDEPDPGIIEEYGEFSVNNELLPELEQKIDLFFGYPEGKAFPKPESAGKNNGTENRTYRHAGLTDDAASLKEEAAAGEHDEELFLIYLRQLQENISLLRSLTDTFANASNKTSIIKTCSELVSALHSSANYMGYARLSEFYDRWIAELEMTSLQFSQGVPVSFDFMDTYIETIVGIFPRIEDMRSDRELHRPDQQSGEATTASSMDELPVNPEFETGADLAVRFEEMPPADNGSPSSADGHDQAGSPFTDDVDETDEEISFDENLDHDIGFPEETDPRRKELFAKLSDALESLANVSAEETEDEEPEEFPDSADHAGDIGEKMKMPEISSSPGREAFQPVDDQQLFDRLSRALDAESSTAGQEESCFAIETDPHLFDKLSRDLDEKEFDRQAAGPKTIDDVINEILAGNGLAGAVPASAEKNLGRVSSESREGVLNVRMVPVAHLFKRYPRLVRDMARQTDKKIKFRLRGEGTGLDEMTLEEIAGPLLHIIRHRIEHGIETIAERRLAGKDESANLLLEAYPDSNAVVIEIRDDGRGIDPEKIKRKALESSIVPAEKIDSMSEPEIFRLIMAPGFSMFPDATRLPGQEAGMDTVLTTIEKLEGTIEISSQVDTGTTIHIRIPLSVSVIQALGVKIGPRIITVPLPNIVETARIRKKDITESDGIELIEHRDSQLPVFRLTEILNIQTGETDQPHAYMLVVQAKGQRAGLIVDGFIHPRETVIKPLSEYPGKESNGFLGATIQDDGTFSPILDIAVLLEKSLRKSL